MIGPNKQPTKSLFWNLLIHTWEYVSFYHFRNHPKFHTLLSVKHLEYDQIRFPIIVQYWRIISSMEQKRNKVGLTCLWRINKPLSQSLREHNMSLFLQISLFLLPSVEKREKITHVQGILGKMPRIKLVTKWKPKWKPKGRAKRSIFYH